MKISIKNVYVISAFIVVCGGGLTIFLNLGVSKKAFGYGTGTAIANGNWNASTTWSFGGVNRVPTCGDTVNIPAAYTVTVSSQENLAGCGSAIIINVDGVLQFTNGNKLDLPCGSIVYVHVGGLVKKSTAGGGSSTLVSICSTTLWTTGDGPIPGPDTLWIQGGGGSSLPIKLMYFEARQNEGKVNLDWATSTEINNDFFTVERSSDGEHFEPVLTKSGAGNSTTNLYYQAIDISPLSGYTFYRLKQTDYDGHYTYSEVKTVKIGNAEEKALSIKSIYPNPYTDSFKISFIAPSDETTDLVIVNTSGEIIAETKIQSSPGFNTYQFLDEKNIKQGIYFAILKSGNQRQIQKIVKS